MSSSFQYEVKLMYREFMRIIYKKPELKRVMLLEKTRNEFKAGAKLSRKDIASIDFAFHYAQRQLAQLKNSNIESLSYYSPKSNPK